MLLTTFIFFSDELSEGQDLLNTGVIGASIYNNKNEAEQPENVELTFKVQNKNVNATGTSEAAQGRHIISNYFLLQTDNVYFGMSERTIGPEKIASF